MEAAALNRILTALEEGKPARSVELNEEEEEASKQLILPKRATAYYSLQQVSFISFRDAPFVFFHFIFFFTCVFTQ